MDIKSDIEYREYNRDNNPEIEYKKYWKNWYDFLGTDINKFPINKIIWKEICNNNNITSLNYIDKVIQYNLKNKNQLPLMPQELYNEFSNLKNELNEYDDFF